MMPVLELIGSSGLGSLLGMRHAFEPDHLAAVSALVTRERSSYQAALIGAWWGLGPRCHSHSGAGLILLRAEMTPRVDGAEFCVALMLVGLGWGVRGGPSGTEGHHRLISTDRWSTPAGVPGAYVGHWTLARRPSSARFTASPVAVLTALVVTTLPTTLLESCALCSVGIDNGDGRVVRASRLAPRASRRPCTVARRISLFVSCISIILSLVWSSPFVLGLLQERTCPVHSGSKLELTPMSTRVLVVEDDPDISELVARALQKAGYTATRVASGRDALDAVRNRPPALIVLDVMLPHVDGLEVCRLLRADEKTAAIPIIMLTARAEESERIVGLEMGADDYVAKPFSPNELVARVRALLRRAQRPESPSARPLAYGAIVMDTDRHTVSLDGKDVTLTAKEFLLLSYLLQHRGRVLSRDVLLEQVWGYRYTGGTRTVDVHVRRLREKLPVLTEALVTVKQFGYKLVEAAGTEP